MATGTVKWFNAAKGYGFIQPQSGGKDVFVHISAVERAGLSTLNEGQTVQYEVVSNRGKESADGHPALAGMQRRVGAIVVARLGSVPGTWSGRP